MKAETPVVRCASLLVPFVLVAGACGDTTATDGAATPHDKAVAADTATPPPDMATPPDLFSCANVMPAYGATLLLEDVSVTVPAGDGGAVTVRQLAPVVAVNKSGSVMHDFDDRNAIGLGCFADHYNLNGGKMPPMDSNAGTIVITGYTMDLMTVDAKKAPNEIDCVVVNGFYQCGYGPAMNGMPGPDTSTMSFPPMPAPIAPMAAIRYRYGGGMLGTLDTADMIKATDTLAVTDDLSMVKYDPTADTTLHFTCPDGMNGMCPLNAVLVTVVAASTLPGQMGFPGTEFAQINCVGLANAGTIKIEKAAIAAGLMNFASVKSFYTRVIRGSLPPSGFKDTACNGVTVAVGRGVSGFALKM
jgi:hypothetical protein